MKRERGPLASVKGAEFYDWRRGDFSMMHFTASPSRHFIFALRVLPHCSSIGNM